MRMQSAAQDAANDHPKVFDFHALTDNNDFLRLAVEGAQIGLWSTDLASGLTDSSRLNNVLFGLDPDGPPFDAATWHKLIHPDDLQIVLACWTNAAQSDAQYDVEYRIVRPDGAVRWILSIGRYHFDGNGAPVRISGISIDITERQQAREALKLADRRKNEFFAVLGHELRNPLAPITIALEIHALPQSTESMRRTAMDVIKRQVTHLTRLVDELLDVSRISHGKFVVNKERTDVGRFINDAAAIAQPLVHAKAQTLSLDIPQETLFVEGDPSRLVQALGNLLNNASKYTPDAGHISLTVASTADQVSIAIKDNGIGIAPDNIQVIFELFAQVNDGMSQRASGLGVGLYLVKQIVELHGGAVFASSEGQGKGSTFTVTLPRAV